MYTEILFVIIMLEVYKTNVRTKAQSEKVLKSLQERFSNAMINFDLQD